MGRRRLRIASLAMMICTVVSNVVLVDEAHAQQALAESLFQEARALLEQGKVAEACPKFAESQRLDPATGTLLGLAMCHEQEGKLASAWAEFVEAQALAKRDGQQQRVDFAKQKAAELRGKLSTLTLAVGEDVAAIDGLEIKRNGSLVGEGAWNAAAPVDGGEHVIEASAPGRLPWSKTITVAPSGAVEAVAIPMLEEAPVEAAPTPAEAPPSETTKALDALPKGEDSVLDAQQWVGIGVAGAGVVSLGVGGFFLLDALSKKSDADCQGSVCDADGVRLSGEAVDSGNLATIFSITGAALIGAGATIYFLSDGPQEQGAAHASRLFVGASGDGLSAKYSGTF